MSEITYNDNRTIKSVTIVDNHGTVVYGRGAKRTSGAAPDRAPATPPKTAQNQTKPAPANAPTDNKKSAGDRRTTVNALRAASKCSSDAIVLFMQNCTAKSYDDLTEAQYIDLVNMIKSYAKEEG